VRVTVLLCWVLALSWLTHYLASPDWRAGETRLILLTPVDASDVKKWSLRQQATGFRVQVGGDESVIHDATVVSEDKALIVARKPGRRGAAFRIVELPKNTSMLRLQAHLRAAPIVRESITLTPEPAFHIKTLNVNGSHRYPLVERPMFFQRTLSIDKLIEISHNTTSVELSLMVSPGSDWQLSKLSLSTVEEHGRYIHSFRALLALWGLTLLLLVVGAWRRSRVSTVLVFTVLAIVLSGVLATRALVVQAFRALAEGLLMVGGELTQRDFHAVMQFGHILLFALLAIVVLATHRRWALHPIQALCGILVVAVASEALQSHVLGRNPNMQDFLFDLIGVCVGSALFVVGTTLFTRKKPIRAPA